MFFVWVISSQEISKIQDGAMPSIWFRRFSNSLNWSHSLLLNQAHQIAMEMHPLNNLRVLPYLENELDINEEKNLPDINTGLLKVLEP